MSLTAVLLFLRANWKYVIGLVLVIVVGIAINNYIDSVYNKGRQAGIDDTTKSWKEKYDRDTAALNKRIADVEQLSKDNAEIAKLELETANGKISTLQEELRKQRSKYDSYVYNQNGAIVCKTDGSIFLGADFSTKWNELNAQIVK